MPCHLFKVVAVRLDPSIGVRWNCSFGASTRILSLNSKVVIINFEQCSLSKCMFTQSNTKHVTGNKKCLSYPSWASRTKTCCHGDDDLLHPSILAGSSETVTIGILTLHLLNISVRSWHWLHRCRFSTTVNLWSEHVWEFNLFYKSCVDSAFYFLCVDLPLPDLWDDFEVSGERYQEIFREEGSCLIIHVNLAINFKTYSQTQNSTRFFCIVYITWAISDFWGASIIESCPDKQSFTTNPCLVH